MPLDTYFVLIPLSEDLLFDQNIRETVNPFNTTAVVTEYCIPSDLS